MRLAAHVSTCNFYKIYDIVLKTRNVFLLDTYESGVAVDFFGENR